MSSLNNLFTVAALAVAPWVLMAPLSGASPITAIQPPDTTLRFDPVTGEPLTPHLSPAFDPLTGLPLIPAPAPAFDPLTGLPVEAEPETPAPAPTRFDPVTGETLHKALPVEASPAERALVAGSSEGSAETVFLGAWPARLTLEDGERLDVIIGLLSGELLTVSQSKDVFIRYGSVERRTVGRQTPGSH